MFGEKVHLLNSVKQQLVFFYYYYSFLSSYCLPSFSNEGNIIYLFSPNFMFAPSILLLFFTSYFLFLV